MPRKRQDTHAQRRAQAIDCVHKAFAALGEWWGTVEITVSSIGPGDVTSYTISTPDDDTDDDDDDDGDGWKHPQPDSGDGENHEDEPAESQ
jgi:hypothetical protein